MLDYSMQEIIAIKPHHFIQYVILLILLILSNDQN